MKYLNIVKSWVINYIIDYTVCTLANLLYCITNRYYNFEYEGETYKIKINTQNLNTILYLYNENLELDDTDKLNCEFIENYRETYLKKHKIPKLQFITQNEIITLNKP
jgi:hypothetical protein